MTIDGFLIAYGGALILPLSVIEGPIVSVATGFLAARGYFPWYWAVSMLICGDLIGDLLCYLLGRGIGGPLSRLSRRLPARWTPSPALRHDLARNSAKMLVVGKWTHSMGYLVLVSAGMLRIPVAKFLLVNLLATIPKSTVLFGVGFFAGRDFPLLRKHALLATVVLGLLGASAILLIIRRAAAARAN